MLIYVVFSLVLLNFVKWIHCSAATLPPPDNVKLIFVGFRHGTRNPAQFLKGDTSHEQWAWEGPGQQTNIGKRQAFSLGQFLRKRYNKLIPSEFFPNKVKCYSPSQGCLVTMQTCMAGLFRPTGRAVWNPDLLWVPVPAEQSDPLLRMSNVKCPKFTEAYQPISNDTDSAASTWLKNNPDLVNYISKNSGLNPTLNDLSDVADNIYNMKLFNATLPNWVTSPKLNGYPPKDIFSAITSFADAHAILCADSVPCARINAGYWLNQIIEILQAVKNGTMKDRVATFYAAHTETVLSLIRLMNVDDVQSTDATAGLILEYTETPAPAVRFIFHEPDPNNFETRLASVKNFKFCSGQQWCSLDTFVQNVKANSFSDWQAACGLPKCP